MKIVIHGTKGGRRIFTAERLPGLLDVTGDSPDSTAIGQEAYALRFTPEHTIFSKYKIIRDVRGDKRTGFLGFSLFLEDKEKLSGEKIVTLLDRISTAYNEKYLVDNNLDEVKEDWGFLERITAEYKSKLLFHTPEDRLESGREDDAFFYFKDTNELKHYFDAPYQEEYSAYRQILFVEKRWQGTPENPLNALRHSRADLTGKIDLKNKYYYLRNYTQSRGVSIRANGKPCSDKKGSNRIREKWEIEIKYSKDETCYYPIEARGTLSDPDSEIYRYLEVKDEKIRIRYDAFNNPRPKEKVVRFEIEDHKRNPVTDAEIQLGSQPKITVNEAHYEHTFKGEDLKRSWIVSGKKGNFKRESHFTLEDEHVTLVLKEQKEISFRAVDEDGLVFNYRVRISNEKGKLLKEENSTDFLFIGEDIEKTFRIAILSNQHKSESFAYCPATDENPKTILLEKKQTTDIHRKGNDSSKYHFKVDERYGERSYKGKPISEFISGVPEFGCDTKPGYIFEGWLKNEEPCEGYDGYYEAVFRESWYRKMYKIPAKVWMITGSVAVAIPFIFMGIHFFQEKSDKPKAGVVQQGIVGLQNQIEEYVQGMSLLMDTLDKYKTAWEEQTLQVNTISNLLPIFWNKNKEEHEAWKIVEKKISEAKQLRELINKLDFKELKETTYSEGQKDFMETINNIDPGMYDAIQEQLGDVSPLTLTQIVFAIRDVPTSTEKVTDNQDNQKQANRQDESLTSVGDVGYEVDDNKSKMNNEENEFLSKLKGPYITFKDLIEPEHDVSIFESSIELYKSFFDLVVVKKSLSKDSFLDLLQKVEADDYLKKSDLASFLTFINHGSDRFNASYRDKRVNIDISEFDGLKLSLFELKQKLGIKQATAEP